MQKYTLLVFFVAMTGCTSTPQRSGSAESYYFDCDTPPGKFSEWNRTINGATINASGTLELEEARKDPRWLPGGSVWLVGSGESGRAGIKAFVMPDSPEYLQIKLVRSAPIVDSPVFASVKWRDGPFPFSMSLSGANLLSATVAGKTQSISLAGFTAAKFSLTCSTGDFHFRDVTVGNGR